MIAAGHEAQLFKSWLDWMEERACKCGHTPLEVEEAFSSESMGSELSYASAKENKYMAPLMENPIPIPVLPPCPQEHLSTVHLPLEEIMEEPREPIVEDLDTLLRLVNEGRVRDLQEDSPCSMVCQGHSIPFTPSA